jgi:hypothetical protein
MMITFDNMWTPSIGNTMLNKSAKIERSGVEGRGFALVKHEILCLSQWL